MQLPEHWKEKLSRRHFPNALLLSGNSREDLANTMAAAYVCEGSGELPCGVCRHCRKSAAGIHPDVIFRGAHPDELKVDAIRALRADAYIRPNEAARKVYVLRGAETMNTNAQNALLKLLEEGPGYATFFFLTKNPESLLPTLRSRCEILQVDAMGEKEAPAPDVLDFLELLCTEKSARMPLCTFCVELEKKKREELTLFLDRSIEAFLPRLLEDPARLLPKMDVLRTLRATCETPVGVGHLCGRLMAELL